MDRFVLDTNLFFNMEPGLGLGKKTEEVVKQVTVFMKRKKAEFFMPPRIVEEFLSFFEGSGEAPYIKNFLAHIIVKSPTLEKQTFPTAHFYKLVEDIRNRNYRGLQIAQEELTQAAREMKGAETPMEKDFQIALGPTIKKLRERYRQATRAGFLDSLADLDCIVLACELDARLVSTDEGVIHWARVFGAREMEAPTFGKWLQGA